MVVLYLFDSIIKKVDNTNNAFKYLWLGIIGKKLDEKKVLYNYFNKL